MQAFGKNISSAKNKNISLAITASPTSRGRCVRNFSMMLSLGLKRRCKEFLFAFYSDAEISLPLDNTSIIRIIEVFLIRWFLLRTMVG